jgi:hypothetical protein
MFLEFPVGAKLAAVARILIAFGGHHPIETSLSAVIRNVVVLYSCILVALRSAETRLHLIIFGHFSFAINIDIFL